MSELCHGRSMAILFLVLIPDSQDTSLCVGSEPSQNSARNRGTKKVDRPSDPVGMFGPVRPSAPLPEWGHCRPIGIWNKARRLPPTHPSSLNPTNPPCPRILERSVDCREDQAVSDTSVVRWLTRSWQVPSTDQARGHIRPSGIRLLSQPPSRKLLFSRALASESAKRDCASGSRH